MKIVLLIAAISGIAYFIFKSKKSDTGNGSGSGSGYGDTGRDEYGYDNTNR